jgi:hypothetical protein
MPHKMAVPEAATSDELPAKPTADTSEDLVFRRGKLRKRDDPAIDLFQDAKAHLDDVARVKRILLELGRLYNPVTDGPILALAHRRRIVELIEGGGKEAAHALLEQCASEYRQGGTRPSP